MLQLLKKLATNSTDWLSPVLPLLHLERFCICFWIVRSFYGATKVRLGTGSENIQAGVSSLSAGKRQGWVFSEDPE